MNPPNLFDLLLSTQALELAPRLEPFWYTSGTVGPFYLNAHFLYGNRQKAEELLAFIDAHAHDRRGLLFALHERAQKNYEEDEGYRAVIDHAVALARTHLAAEHVAYVSGGERRDWFFSLMIAHRLDKPGLAIFKDQTTFLFSSKEKLCEEAARLAGAKILHVADLVTEASSYTRAWLPALQQRGGELRWAINIVDRGQGGEEVLRQNNVAPFHLIQLGAPFFEHLQRAGYLDAATKDVLCAYLREPRASMKRLLEEHPEIVRHALQSSEAKTRQRAEQMLAQNPYGFTPEQRAKFFVADERRL
jgi:orotate phosphoribosyltransferase